MKAFDYAMNQAQEREGATREVYLSAIEHDSKGRGAAREAYRASVDERIKLENVRREKCKMP